MTVDEDIVINIEAWSESWKGLTAADHDLLPLGELGQKREIRSMRSTSMSMSISLPLAVLQKRREGRYFGNLPAELGTYTCCLFTVPG